jgi:hypothetical protein
VTAPISLQIALDFSKTSTCLSCGFRAENATASLSWSNILLVRKCATLSVEQISS